VNDAAQATLPMGSREQESLQLSQGLTVITPDVALDNPSPLAVRVVVPGPTPVRFTVADDVLPTANETVDGTVATPGALLVRLAVNATAVAWLPE
jgi:hypothetical protein